MKIPLHSLRWNREFAMKIKPVVLAAMQLSSQVIGPVTAAGVFLTGTGTFTSAGTLVYLRMYSAAGTAWVDDLPTTGDLP